mmetsp:Transcript_27402/g.43936  ORF Transcript_27402/g.43936 Transcript_27402/m.43936 type:complete len:239 (+) Transcript_27402:783-1499(+)
MPSTSLPSISMRRSIILLQRASRSILISVIGTVSPPEAEPCCMSVALLRIRTISNLFETISSIRTGSTAACKCCSRREPIKSMVSWNSLMSLSCTASKVDLNSATSSQRASRSLRSASETSLRRTLASCTIPTACSMCCALSSCLRLPISASNSISKLSGTDNGAAAAKVSCNSTFLGISPPSCCSRCLSLACKAKMRSSCCSCRKLTLGLGSTGEQIRVPRSSFGSETAADSPRTGA